MFNFLKYTFSKNIYIYIYDYLLKIFKQNHFQNETFTMKENELYIKFILDNCILLITKYITIYFFFKKVYNYIKYIH